MSRLPELARAARESLAFARAQPGVREAEVFVAENASLLARLCYTSHIPCNGVEEPKSVISRGLGIRAAFEHADGPRIGFGSEPADLGARGAERALARARAAAVRDPEFVSLPRPRPEPRTLFDYHDPRLVDLDDASLVEAGWKIVTGGLAAFRASSRLADLAGDEAGLRALGLILGGDVTVLRESIAVASTHLPEVQTDESTLMPAFVTAMVEARDAKGSGWSTSTRLDHFTEEAGVEAAQNAVAAIDGVRVPAGEYTVVFGEQPVADLLNNLVVPVLTSTAFYSSRTPFLGKAGRQVLHPSLTIYDHGAMPGFMGSKGITCEGLPTGRTDLVREGVLVGCLSSWYETQRLLADPALGAKLGLTGAEAARALAPRNGFRFETGGGRQFDAPPSIAASNIVVEGRDAVSRETLIASVRDGLYVGRIWYTYPINGMRAGDFTCTVIGDSYIIRDGRLAEPLRPNTLRINDNVVRALTSVVGITKDVKGTIVWAADEVAYVPEIAVAGVPVEAIGGFMEDIRG